MPVEAILLNQLAATGDMLVSAAVFFAVVLLAVLSVFVGFWDYRRVNRVKGKRYGR